MSTITVTRDPLYFPGRTNGRLSHAWIYSYSLDGAAVVEYGTQLAQLRSWAKRKGYTVITTWEQS